MFPTVPIAIVEQKVLKFLKHVGTSVLSFYTQCRKSKHHGKPYSEGMPVQIHALKSFIWFRSVYKKSF